jgi:hypothetical protein
VKKEINKMAIESVNREFEVFMRDMMKAQECIQENIETELRQLIRVTVNSCATMYGFSAEEALKRLNSNGEIIETPLVPTQQKEEISKEKKVKIPKVSKEEKALKEAEKAKESSERSAMKEQDVISKAAEKLALKEAEKALKKSINEAEKAKKLRFKEAEKALDEADRVERLRAKKTEKALKEAEKLALKEKKKKAKTVKKSEEEFDSDASTVIMTDSENEDPLVLFQNIPLIDEINSIRDVKKFKNWKKLSSGVKLARQILDI